MTNQPDGGATATILNVDQGLEIPVGSIAQAGSTVTLGFTSIEGSYTGVLNADGTELAGTFSQGPGTVPLTFRRGTQ